MLTFPTNDSAAARYVIAITMFQIRVADNVDEEKRAYRVLYQRRNSTMEHHFRKM